MQVGALHHDILADDLVLEHRQRIHHAAQCGSGQQPRVTHCGDADVLQLQRAHQRRGLARPHAQAHVHNQRLGHAFRDLGDVFLRQQRVGIHHVGAGLGIHIEAADCLIDAVRTRGIGTRHDDEIIVAARIDRGLDLLHHFLSGDTRLAGHVTAAFGPHLVLDHQRRHAGLLKSAHDKVHGHRIAVTGVGIGAQQQVRAVGESPRIVQIFIEGHHTAVGPAHAAFGHACTGNRRGLESRLLDQPHAVAVIDAGLDQDFLLVDQFLELLASARHGALLRINECRRL